MRDEDAGMTKHADTDKQERRAVLRLPGGRTLSLASPLVMGTLNVTPDSFSDGGRYTSRALAIGRALEMEGEGAAIIDVGGESTRPGAIPIEAEEEMRRAVPVVEGIRRASNIPISIDTYHAVTARAALDAGASMVNDISALRSDPAMAPLVAERGVPVVLMHMLGTPRTMQNDPQYDNCVEEIGLFFRDRVAYAAAQGIQETRIILDPGIGFGKRLTDNLEILAHLRKLRAIGFPLMVGASRKRFIAMVHPSGKAPDERLGGSIAAAVAAVMNGADLVRVHDVAQTVEALRVVQAMREAE